MVNEMIVGEKIDKTTNEDDVDCEENSAFLQNKCLI